MDNQTKELEILNALLDFKLLQIPENTRFWMIRTQKGYFYDEFITHKFVALAWNNIDQATDFSIQSRDYLKDYIKAEFHEISRPSTVINKCYNFIHEIHKGDILAIPSKGSKYITFASAGEYFEDLSKTVALEKTIISKIDKGNIDAANVSCPYKKRRKIKLMRTVKSDDINTTLYKAISNYHGISNLDAYAYQILNELYNCYSYKDYAVLVYNIRKTKPIKPRELSQLIYGNTECLCSIIPEENISTQMELHSPGDAIYMLQKAFEIAKDNWEIIFGLLVFFGGGSALTFKVPGITEIAKNILSFKEDYRAKKLDNDSKELEVKLKRLEFQQKLKESGIKPESLLEPLESVIKSSNSLMTEPIILCDESHATSSDNESEESNDTKDE